jgi:membrane protease YdiL (CAAX protease family)
MATIGPNQILLAILLLLALWLLLGMVLSSGWLLYQLLNRRPIFPDHPLVDRRPVPWNLGTVLLVIVVYPLVSLVMPAAYDLATGRKPVKPSDSAMAQARVTRKTREEAKVSLPVKPDAASAKALSKNRAADAGPRVRQASPAAARGGNEHRAQAARASVPGPEKAYSMTEMMVILAATNLVLLVLLPWIARLTSGATLADYGVSLVEWRAQAAVGAIAALAAAPMVYSVQFLAIRIWKSNAHPLQKMLLDEFSPGVAELAILSGVIIAPIFEELMFRGLFQSWLVTRFGRRRPVPASQPQESAIEGNASPAISKPWDHEGDSWDATDLEKVHAPESAPRAELVHARGTMRSAPQAIVVTSFLFASVHSSQWPAPIALFLLSLVISTVYYRTGSLIAAVVIHATFNGFSTLLMFITLLAGPIVDANKARGAAVEAALFRTNMRHRGETRISATAKIEIAPKFPRRPEIGLLK